MNGKNYLDHIELNVITNKLSVDELKMLCNNQPAVTKIGRDIKGWVDGGYLPLAELEGLTSRMVERDESISVRCQQ